jgi:hypothetical protein
LPPPVGSTTTESRPCTDARDGLFLQRQEAVRNPDAANGLVEEFGLDDGAIIDHAKAGRA